MKKILANAKERYSKFLSYESWRIQIGKDPILEEYNEPRWHIIHIEPMWDDKPNGLIRVCIDLRYGFWRQICPHCTDFLISPDGQVDK